MSSPRRGATTGSRTVGASPFADPAGCIGVGEGMHAERTRHERGTDDDCPCARTTKARASAEVRACSSGSGTRTRDTTIMSRVL